MQDELWEIERSLWTDGADVFARRLALDCLMAFPPPVGLLRGRDAILATLAETPRWSSLTVGEAMLAATGEDAAVLAYRALAQREGRSGYEAFCTSTYLRQPDGLRLVQHQQTPIG